MWTLQKCMKNHVFLYLLNNLNAFFRVTNSLLKKTFFRLGNIFFFAKVRSCGNGARGQLLIENFFAFIPLCVLGLSKLAKSCENSCFRLPHGNGFARTFALRTLGCLMVTAFALVPFFFPSHPPMSNEPKIPLENAFACFQPRRGKRESAGPCS